MPFSVSEVKAEGNAPFFPWYVYGSVKDLHDVGSHGEAYAVAFDLAAVGDVVAVEAFEEFRVVYIFSFCKVVGDYYRKTFFFFLCRDFHLHASFFVAVFHGVIQKDAEDLSKEFFFWPDVDAGRYTGFERLPPFSRHLSEVACDGFRDLGNIHIFQLDRKSVV